MPRAIQDDVKREPTSINANPELWKKVKIEAINRGTTVTELFEKSLEKELSGDYRVPVPKDILDYLGINLPEKLQWKKNVVKGQKIVELTRVEDVLNEAERISKKYLKEK